MSSNVFSSKSKLIANLNTPWKMRFYFWQKLPSLIFWGVRIKYCDTDQAAVTIPFSWRTQNPFRSTYFAALCGAAELSTGILGLIAIEGQGRISMLIINIEAAFYKKATGLTTFTCQEGKKIEDFVQKAIESGEAQEVRVTSFGTNASGEAIAKVTLTWSFKKK